MVAFIVTHTLRKLYPDNNWLDMDKQPVKQKLWTKRGIYGGLDPFGIHFLPKQNIHFWRWSSIFMRGEESFLTGKIKA